MSALHRERWFPAWLVLPGSLTLMLLWLLPLAVLVQLTLGVSSGTLGRFWHMLSILACGARGRGLRRRRGPGRLRGFVE